ncbi:glyoxalase domain-containing protein 4 [Galendromus occidentalis]|uniref:Glyoxalase domain-containing protein 4 n=1 Tax=Galendromus occidentalis TaxID=34638 RepID=A0AAJ6VVG6_9ACAR|nr:glyoxalase domain-containing protein 4 [Galendromus occidentalis]
MSFFRRPLHYVFKIADRKATMDFYMKILGMRVLRHEEFEEGCKAACNGRYDGRWSKTMIGYGSEDSHFVLELTYNYGIPKYRRGNEFHGIVIQGEDIVERAKAAQYPVDEDDHGQTFLEAPGGYRFYIRCAPSEGDPVKQVIYNSSCIEQTERFWRNVLDQPVEKGENSIEVSTCLEGFTLKFQKLPSSLDRGEAFGRIAFSCPKQSIPEIESAVKAAGLGSIITPLISLDTPGKATVQVVIVGDPDGHEICFVGDEAYRELSQADPGSEQVLWKKVEEFEGWKSSGTRF